MPAPALKPYQLDSSDEMLVVLAAEAQLARDKAVAARVRLAASARFQATVKQLALVARTDAAAKQSEPVEEPPKREPRLRIVRRRSGVDPRLSLMPGSDPA